MPAKTPIIWLFCREYSLFILYTVLDLPHISSKQIRISRMQLFRLD